MIDANMVRAGKAMRARISGTVERPNKEAIEPANIKTSGIARSEANITIRARVRTMV